MTNEEVNAQTREAELAWLKSLYDDFGREKDLMDLQALDPLCDALADYINNHGPDLGYKTGVNRVIAMAVAKMATRWFLAEEERSFYVVKPPQASTP